MISKFGHYQADSDKVYDGAQRSSAYLSLSDGTRIAYDLFLPTQKGKPAAGPLPVLFLYTPYLRVFTVFDQKGKSNLVDLESLGWMEQAYLRVRSWLAKDGNLFGAPLRRRYLQRLLASGYAVCVAERPGTGASFGKMDMSNDALARECDDILNWIASQAWCDGKIGMFGDSWQAQVQLVAASTGNPHLKAILPASTWWENYSGIMYPGGIFNKGFASFFVWSQKLLDSPLITPVDADPDGKILAQALAERRSATTAEVAESVFPKIPLRDSRTPGGLCPWDHSTLENYIERVNASGVPVYLMNGWFDFLARENFLIYANLKVPKRLTVRPTDHSDIEKSAADLDFGAEAQRWFDYWLKGIDTGILSEPPIHYLRLNDGKQGTWQTATEWPLHEAQARHYFMSTAPSGALSLNSPAERTSPAAYKIDASTTTGKQSRWVSVEGAHHYPDMRGNDGKAMTYTTPPLEQALNVTGHAIVHAWLCTDAPDLDVFAYLEEVDAQGKSTYLTEGSLRASHRQLAAAPYENLGLPFHPHRKDGLQPIPAGEPFELVFDLLPTACRFAAGSRLRVALAFADADNFATPLIEPTPHVQLLSDPSHPSYVEIPILN